MKLSDFFEEIAYGELSDLSYAEGGMINDENKPKVVIRINDVLSKLHTKYVLRTEEAVIDTSVKDTRYSYANENSIRIIYVVPSPEDEASLYRNNDNLAVVGNSLVFLAPPKGNSFPITYQWCPSKLAINPTTTDYLDQEVNVPSVLVPLVRTLVASALFTGSNGELHKKTGAELFNQAQYIQAELEMSGILNLSVPFKNNQFVISGFK